MANSYRKIGQEFSKGVLDVVGFLIIIGIAIQLLWHAIAPIDDSDFSRWNRSGVKIVTDAKSGQQYLVTPEGGIVERAP